VEGETELAFAHALVRDVAYGQIARADRAEKHRSVAEWIESLGRPDDHAEMLAYHWRSSLDLARASGKETAELVDATRLALRDAGDRAVALNAFVPAEAYYSEALSLWPEKATDRPDLLFRRAHALYVSGDERREHALEEARDAALANGNMERAAEAETYLSRGAWFGGQREAAYAHLDRAVELLEGVGPSAGKARVLSHSARLRFLAGDLDEALRIAGDALTLAEELDLDELRAHALATIGSAKNRLDFVGSTELEQALAIASEANSPQVPNILNNLGVFASMSGDVARAGELYAEGLRAAERTGDRDIARFMRANLLFTSYFLGAWDQLLEDADGFIAECEVSPHYMEAQARRVRGYVRLARNDARGAVEDLDRSLVLAREIKDPQALLPSLLGVAQGYALLGRDDEAHDLAREAIEVTRAHSELAAFLAVLNGLAKRFDIGDELRELIQRAADSPWKDAALAGVEGDFVRAADVYAAIGTPVFEAEERLNAAAQLIALGRRVEGEEQLEQALAFYRSAGAPFFVERGEALRAQAATG
jgi:hypothetical protein